MQSFGRDRSGGYLALDLLGLRDIRCGNLADLDLARLHRLGNLAHEVDVKQAVLQACVAHLDNLLGGSDIAGVVAVDFSQLPEELRARLIEQRDEYEGRLAQLIDGLELREGVDRRLMRLSLLGSLNWTPNWFRADGQTPASIARHFVALLREGVA